MILRLNFFQAFFFMESIWLCHEQLLEKKTPRCLCEDTYLIGLLLKYKVGWTGGLVLREKCRDLVSKGLKVIKQELAQGMILASSALIESAARSGSSTLV